ncbi:MAG: hypothetical protein HQL26_08760 [Candidatus Omnitrophica bacterium]|nr:hypothetical protein [Candidatus Omnitrophota bacterium]
MNISWILKQSFILYKKYYRRLLPWGFFLAVAAAIGNAFVMKIAQNETMMMFWGVIIGTIFTSWPQMILYLWCLHVIRNGDTPEDFQQGLSALWGAYLATVFAFQIMIFSGLLLLVIPGFFFLGIFWFAPILVLDLKHEEAWFSESFKQSAKLVKGFFWPTLTMLFLTAIIISVPVLVLKYINFKYADSLISVWTAIAAPYIYLCQVQMYISLNDLKKEQSAG